MNKLILILLRPTWPGSTFAHTTTTLRSARRTRAVLELGLAFALAFARPVIGAEVVYTAQGSLAAFPFDPDPLGLDGASFEMSFTFDDAATRTFTNGVNVDGFRPLTDVVVVWTGTVGGVNDGTTSRAPTDTTIFESEPFDNYRIDFEFPDGVQGSLRFPNGSAGDATTGPTNVFDPISPYSGFDLNAIEYFDGIDFTFYDVTWSSVTLDPVFVDSDGDGIPDPEDADRDGDGIPNDVETAATLDPDDPSDGPLDLDSDTWTNVEEYRFATGINDFNSTPVGQTNPHQKAFASDGNGIGAVVVDGNTALIGSENADGALGAAYVFTRPDPLGLWTEQAKLVASDGVPGDRMGFKPALDGDTALLGARNADSGQGAAYVFERSGSVWTEVARLTASDGLPGDEFGWGAALDGDTAVVGAPGAAAAYVFTRSGGVWSEDTKLTVTGFTGSRFGEDVGLDGDTIIVGDYLEGQAGPVGPIIGGAAYVFTRTNGFWSQEAKLVADDAQDGDLFGYTARVEGDTAAIGAFFEEDNGSRAGAAYVFTRSFGPAGLIAQYAFDEASGPDRNDSSGVNTVATESGSGHLYATAAIPDGTYGALTLSGTPFGSTGGVSGTTGDWQTASSNELGAITNDFTVMGWIRPDSVAFRQRILSRVSSGTGGWGFGLNGPGELILTGFGVVDAISSGAGVQAGVWQHVAVTKSSTTGIRFYVNGVLVDSNPAQTGAFGASTSAWGVLGRGNERFGGLADEIKAYDVVLDASEIADAATASASWSQEAKLLASDGQEADRFGLVSISGETIYVGMFADVDSIGEVAEGTGYVYVRSGGVWSERQKLIAYDGGPADGFSPGDVDGNTVVSRTAGSIYFFRLIPGFGDYTGVDLLAAPGVDFPSIQPIEDGTSIDFPAGPGSLLFDLPILGGGELPASEAFSVELTVDLTPPQADHDLRFFITDADRTRVAGVEIADDAGGAVFAAYGDIAGNTISGVLLPQVVSNCGCYPQAGTGFLQLDLTVIRSGGATRATGRLTGSGGAGSLAFDFALPVDFDPADGLNLVMENAGEGDQLNRLAYEVPEPGIGLGLALGALGLAMLRRRERRFGGSRGCA